MELVDTGHALLSPSAIFSLSPSVSSRLLVGTEGGAWRGLGTCILRRDSRLGEKR